MRKQWKTHHRHRAPWLLIFLLLAGGWFLFGHSESSQAKMGRSQPVKLQPANIEGETYWTGDVTVEDGQTVDGDLVAYSGDIAINDGGKVTGSVVSYSGDVDVEEDALVSGDLTAWSGTVRVDGTINGSIAAWSGDIELGESAQVDGDVSAMSGNVDRSDGAKIQGSIVIGPGFKWPGLGNPFEKINIPAPEAPAALQAPQAPQPPQTPRIEVRVRDSAPGIVERFFGFVLRMIGAVFFSVIAALAAAVVFNVRPELVARIRSNIQEQPVYAAVAGAVLNVPLLLMASLLYVTFCLGPLALPSLLLLLVLNVVGATGLAQIVGERLTKALNLKLEAVFVVAVGAFAVIGAVSLLWALGGCFRGVAGLAGFVGGSMGVGALIMPWIKNFGSGVSKNLQPSLGEPLASSTAGSVDVTIGNDGTKSTATEQAPSTPPVPPVAVQIIDTDATPAPVVAAPIATIQVEVQGVEPIAPAAPVEIALPAASIAPTEQSADATPTTSGQLLNVDDFTIIKGVGMVLDRRLKEAGVLTFAQLAELTPERLADIFDRPLSWILEDDIIGQAGYFARNK